MRRLSVLTLTAILLTTLTLAAVPTHAASGFASPAFQTQWQADEAKLGNFWGPLANAREGQQELYGGTQRFVQYFDKGRMELTSGTVTNGLLASEIVRGQVQTGDATFETRPASAIAVAGDPDGGAPTYAQIAASASVLLNPAPNRVGQQMNVAFALGAFGTVLNGTTDNLLLTEFDTATRHNVFVPFAQFRQQVGVSAVGLAISEPFVAEFKVGGTTRNAAVQVFERRVLTHTPANPEAFRVEFGNIGQHYYQWRYSASTPTTTRATSASPPPAASVVSTANRSSFTDRLGLLRVQAPSGWLKDDAHATGSTILQLTGPGVSIVNVSSSTTDATTLPSNALEIMKQAVLTQGTAATFGDSGDAVIGGTTAKRLVFTTTISGVQAYGRAWVLVRSGRIFVFISLSISTDASDVNAIVNSTTFLDGSAASTSAPAPAPPVTAPVASNRYTDGNLAITNWGVRDPAPSSTYLKPKSGNRCVGVDITVENAGGGSLHYNPLNSSVQTSDDRQYPYTGLCSSLAPILSFGDLANGQRVRGYVTFEIPADAVLASFTWRDYDGHRLTFRLR